MATNKNQILVVCTANICRSPMAQKLLEHALDAEPPPLSQLKVESAGIAATSGEPPSPHSVTVLQAVNLDLSQHQSQPLTSEMIDSSFLILGMTRSHLEVLRYSFDNLPGHLHLFREFLEREDADPEIPDPFGMDMEAYAECRDTMIEAIPSIIRYLRAECG